MTLPWLARHLIVTELSASDSAMRYCLSECKKSYAISFKQIHCATLTEREFLQHLGCMEQQADRVESFGSDCAEASFRGLNGENFLAVVGAPKSTDLT